MFKTPQDFNCLRKTDFLTCCEVVVSSSLSDLVEALNTQEAKVNTKPLQAMASTRIKGNIRNTGIAISPCIVMHTYCVIICNVGIVQTKVGTILSMRYAFIDFSIS